MSASPAPRRRQWEVPGPKTQRQASGSGADALSEAAADCEDGFVLTG